MELEEVMRWLLKESANNWRNNSRKDSPSHQQTLQTLIVLWMLTLQDYGLMKTNKIHLVLNRTGSLFVFQTVLGLVK